MRIRTEPHTRVAIGKHVWVIPGQLISVAIDVLDPWQWADFDWWPTVEVRQGVWEQIVSGPSYTM